MSADQITALVAAVSADPGLAERFAGLASVDEAVALAAELGFTVTGDELLGALAQTAGQDVSDAELAQASGGTGYPSQATCNCHTMYHLGC